MQEGYIAMWRALDGFNEAEGALASWVTRAARRKMLNVAYGHDQWTGHDPMRGRKPPPSPVSLDEVLDEEPDLPVIADDLLEGVEMAYHDGEIMQALNALTEAQRRYVVARFWHGLDPASRVPGVRALFNEVGGLSERGLWNDYGATTGARAVLAQSLAHLGVEFSSGTST